MTGARQTGKTTLLRAEFAGSHCYVSLEDPDVRASVHADPRGFLAQAPPPVILDEIQHAPTLLSHIKSRIDKQRLPGQWLLTGSQTFPLMREVTQSLAGRAAILRIGGLTAEELAPTPGFATAAEILRGAFPEPRLDARVDWRLWMSSFVQTYVERDVRALAQVADLRAFETFLRLCAIRTGQILNVSELARDAAVAPTTAKRWLGVLEASDVFSVLQPFLANRTKRLVRAPKLYAADSGLSAWLSGLRDETALWEGPLRGALFETRVYGEIMRTFRHRGEEAPLTYWRASDGLEVDFVLELGGRLHAIECRANATPIPRMAESLVRWRRLHEHQVGETLLVCDVDGSRPLASDVLAINWRTLGARLAALAKLPS